MRDHLLYLFLYRVHGDTLRYFIPSHQKEDYLYTFPQIEIGFLELDATSLHLLCFYSQLASSVD